MTNGRRRQRSHVTANLSAPRTLSEGPTDETGDVGHHPTASVESLDVLDSMDVGEPSETSEAMDGKATKKSRKDVEVMGNIDGGKRPQDTPTELAAEAPSAHDLSAAKGVGPGGENRRTVYQKNPPLEMATSMTISLSKRSSLSACDARNRCVPQSTCSPSH